VLASVGYLVTSLGWRWWVGAKRKRRLAEARERRMGAA
jgi:hypothetical protein